jgi:hypothetical protein
MVLDMLQADMSRNPEMKIFVGCYLCYIYSLKTTPNWKSACMPRLTKEAGHVPTGFFRARRVRVRQ